MPAIGSVSTVAAVFPITSAASISVPAAAANGSQTVKLNINDAASARAFSGFDGTWSGPIIAPGTGENNRALVWYRNDTAGTGLSATTISLTWTGGAAERVAIAYDVDARLYASTLTDATPYGTTHACPSVTAPTGGGLWVHVFGALAFGGRTSTPPAGVTEIADLDSGSLTAIHAGTISVAAGATGASDDWTTSDGNTYGAFSLLYANPVADAAVAVVDPTLSLTQAMPDLDALTVIRQSQIGAPVLGGSTCSVTMPQVPLVGSLLVASAGGVMPGVTGGSVASVPALTWVPAAVRLAGTPTDAALFAWVAKVDVTLSDPPVITFTRTPAGDVYGSLLGMELADPTLTTGGVVVASASGTGTSAVAPVTSTAANAHIVSLLTYHASSASATTPSTWSPGPTKQGSSALASASKVKQAVGTYSPTWTLSESTTWCAITLALQAGGGGSSEGGGTTPTAPTITTGATLPAQSAGASIAIALAATGSLPMTWSASGLPAGLFIDPSSGLLTGTLAAGTYAFSVTASNGTLPNSTRAFSLTVSAAREVLTSSLPIGTVGAAYSATLTATATPTSWTLIGQLPAGLTFSSAGATATITGTPTLAESRSFDVRANYTGGVTATRTLVLTVNAAGAITDSGGWSRWLQR